jgi:branched-chain amino acid transport system ATP-binding protein
MADVILDTQNIRVRYRNGALGVLDVSLNVHAGEVVALFGPNGAGKTTTARAISGFLRSEGARVIDGSVKLFGHDTTNLEPHRTAAMGLTFVPERKKIFPSMTVAENLEVLARRPPRNRRDEIYAKIYEIFPVLGERRRSVAGLLSGGEQQMLAIARTFMSSARLLIIDEATLGLHHSVHGPLYEVIKSVAAEGAGVLVVDEDSGSALDAADRWYLLAAGTVQSVGTAAERSRTAEILSEQIEAL